MTPTGMLAEALVLMMVGMSVVFAFLTLLIGVIGLIRRLDQAVGAGANESAPTGVHRQPCTADSVNQNRLQAVIAAAVHQYRQRR